MADACEQCGSTRFHVDAGLRYCRNGHLQAGGQQVADDSDEYLNQGKRTKRKKEKPKVKASKIYRGPRAYKLFLQAYQHIIWKQCYALIHRKGLPSELWTVVRDLWTLRLAKQADKLETPSAPDQERQASFTKAETSDESGNEVSDALQASGKNASDSPVLVETIALCYLGILLMRLPVGIGDIYRWIRTEDIPYFRAVRHVPPEMTTHLPGEYQRALDTETILSPDGLQTAIYRLCSLYTTEFGMSFPAINSPHLLFQHIKQLALPLEIYPTVKNLNKKVNFTFKYSLASDSQPRRTAISHPEAQLISLVVVATKLMFPFDSDVVKRYPRSLNEPAAQRINWRKWVELRQQASLPLTDTAAAGPTTSTTVDVDEVATRAKPPLQKGHEVEVTDADIFHMSGTDLDRYMDWYQRTWIKAANDSDTNPNKEIQDMFPLTPLPADHEDPQADTEREVDEAQRRVVRAVHAAMKMNRVISDEDAAQQQQQQREKEGGGGGGGGVKIKRPGQAYRLYMRVDDLPPDTAARAFYEAAAEASCMSLERLVRAVRQTETRIETWKKERRRTELFDKAGGIGGGDGDEEGDEDEDADVKMIT